MARRYTYARLTAEEFSSALAQLDLSPNVFARLTGSAPDRVMRWIIGTEDIPHHIGVVCVAFTVPGVLELAARFTNRMADRRPRDGPDDKTPSRS
jgi:hypothetical protein